MIPDAFNKKQGNSSSLIPYDFSSEMTALFHLSSITSNHEHIKLCKKDKSSLQITLKHF